MLLWTQGLTTSPGVFPGSFLFQKKSFDFVAEDVLIDIKVFCAFRHREIEIWGNNTESNHYLPASFQNANHHVIASTNNDRGSATYDREKYRARDAATLIKTGTYNCNFICKGY